MEVYLHSPSTPSWRGAQLKYGDNFTFLPLSLMEEVQGILSSIEISFEFRLVVK
jgi:hypothetical protein